MRCGEELATALRMKPTLPASYENNNISWTDVETALRIPLYSCPFKGCICAASERLQFLFYLAGEQRPTSHYEEVHKIGGEYVEWMQTIVFIYGTITVRERAAFPTVDLSVTLHAVRILALNYNDREIKALVCFCCGQIRTTMKGAQVIAYDTESVRDVRHGVEIAYVNRGWFANVEEKCPGTLLHTCRTNA